MPTQPGERVLLRLRTHPKVLFQPVVIQIALIAAHIALYLYWPASTGFALVDEWGQLCAHVLIALVELTYTVLPTLRWYNAVFVVTDRRLQEHWGVFYRSAKEVSLDRIASVSTERGILDRIFGCATLVFHDATVQQAPQRSPLTQRSGHGNDGIRFHDIPRYAEVARTIDAARFGSRA